MYCKSYDYATFSYPPNEVNLPKGNKIFPADRKLTNILEIFVADDPTSLAFLSTWSEEL